MLGNCTTPAVFQDRWHRLQERCRTLELDALLIWSRGGGSVDCAQDLIYLANVCSATPLVPDLQGVWSGLSCSALVLPAHGEPVLVVDAPRYRRQQIPVQDVRTTSMVADTAAAVLHELGLGRARIGLVAGDAMALASYRRLLQACPEAEFVPCDKLVEQMRRIKSPMEMDLLRQSAQLGSHAMAAMMRTATQPGCTEAYAVSMASQIITAGGGTVIDAATASGPHTEFYAFGQAPSWTTRILQQGDLFHCDLYGSAIGGYRFDLSRTVVCGRSPSAAQRHLIEAAAQAVADGIDAVRPGAVAHDIWRTVRDSLLRAGMQAPHPLAGHGYGLGWEGPWLIEGSQDVVEEQMALSIETIAALPGVGCAKFEQDILVHAGGCELLTAACPSFMW